MTAGRLPWVAWPLGTVNDGKLGLAADNAKISMAVGLGIWAVLLEEGGAASDRGSVQHIHYGAMARTLGISHDDVARFVDEVVALGLIVDARIVRQDYFEVRRMDPTNADRSRRFRARQPSGAKGGAPGTATLRKRCATLRTPTYERTNVRTDEPTDLAGAGARPSAAVTSETASRAVSASPPEFAELRAAYPRRAGSNPPDRALNAIHARLRDGHTWAEILDGARRYAAFVRATGKERTQYVMHLATFCGPEKHFLEAWNPPATRAEQAQTANVAAADEWLGRGT